MHGGAGESLYQAMTTGGTPAVYHRAFRGNYHGVWPTSTPPVAACGCSIELTVARHAQIRFAGSASEMTNHRTGRPIEFKFSGEELEHQLGPEGWLDDRLVNALMGLVSLSLLHVAVCDRSNFDSARSPPCMCVCVCACRQVMQAQPRAIRDRCALFSTNDFSTILELLDGTAENPDALRKRLEERTRVLREEVWCCTSILICRNMVLLIYFHMLQHILASNLSNPKLSLAGHWQPGLFHIPVQ